MELWTFSRTVESMVTSVGTLGEQVECDGCAARVFLSSRGIEVPVWTGPTRGSGALHHETTFSMRGAPKVYHSTALVIMENAGGGKCTEILIRRPATTSLRD